MNQKRPEIDLLYQNLPRETRELLDEAIKRIASVKEKGGKVVVITGSGPNVHEGVTTLLAELIHKGVVDGITTSSAVVAHEMAGVLEEVKRIDGKKLGFSKNILPRGDIFEINLMPSEWLEQVKAEMPVDTALIDKALALEGDVIIKAAGNMAYPMGLRTENLAKEILFIARSKGLPFESVAGAGADSRTMIGAANKQAIPLIVTIPQLVGGGMVGLAIGDSISTTERAAKLARMLQKADVIIESAVALTQEIHDGPFETHTGHGIWSHWEGYPTYTLEDKVLIRIDLDPNLKQAWDFEKKSGEVQRAVDQGLPKTKLMAIPFRMEMSGFARLPNSIPVVADIGIAWPIIAYHLENRLDISLDFMSYPQQSPQGREMRNWIVKNIQPIDRKELYRDLPDRV